jgi:phosphatidylinositol-3-phosphatase
MARYLLEYTIVTLEVSDGAMNATLRARRRRTIVVVLAAILLPLVGVVSVSAAMHSSGGPVPTATPPAKDPSSSPGPFFPTPIHHVILVLFENTEADSVLAGAPYEKQLAQQYAYLNHSYAVCHPSEPNYLALITGLQTQCQTDNYAVLDQYNLADQLESQGFTWKEYAESMPAPCYTQDTSLYAVRHNPFVFMQDIVDNQSRCDSHVVNFTQWDKDVASGSIPNFAFITPNINDDGHNTQFSYADAWLQGWLAPLLTKPWFSSTAVIVTYDEGLTDAGYAQDGIPLWGGNIYTVIVSPYSHGIGWIQSNVSHFNTLTTIEWLFGLGSFSTYDDFTGFPPVYAAFDFPSPPSLSSSGAIGTVGADASAVRGEE